MQEPQELPENSLEAFFDEGLEQQELYNQMVEKQANRLHRLFVQNEEGKALLQEWKNSLIMVPTVSANSTQFEAGINEGVKLFIRNIINQVESVEKGDE
jgi:hypothetical protein